MKTAFLSIVSAVLALSPAYAQDTKPTDPAPTPPVKVLTPPAMPTGLTITVTNPDGTTTTTTAPEPEPPTPGTGTGFPVINFFTCKKGLVVQNSRVISVFAPAPGLIRFWNIHNPDGAVFEPVERNATNVYFPFGAWPPSSEIQKVYEKWFRIPFKDKIKVTPLPPPAPKAAPVAPTSVPAIPPSE